MAASRTKGIKAKTVDALVWFHRWLGVATCLVFALWFASGAVLLFKPFPSLDRGSQLALSAPIDSAAIAAHDDAAPLELGLRDAGGVVRGHVGASLLMI